MLPTARPALGLLAASTLWLAAGCGDHPASQVAAPDVGARAPRLAKGSVDTSPRAILSFAELVDTTAGRTGVLVPAGIRGDGRTERGAVGTPVAYRGNYCGVATTLGADLNFDVDTYYASTMATACGGPRRFAFHVDGPDAAPFWTAPHSIARGLGTLAVGERRTQWEGFGVGLRTDCTGLRFDDLYAPNSSSPEQERLADTTVTNAAGQTVPARRWRIRSRPPHRAMCITKDKRGNEIPSGVTYHLPFELAVTEMPYPYGTYP